MVINSKKSFTYCVVNVAMSTPMQIEFALEWTLVRRCLAAEIRYLGVHTDLKLRSLKNVRFTPLQMQYSADVKVGLHTCT